MFVAEDAAITELVGSASNKLLRFQQIKIESKNMERLATETKYQESFVAELGTFQSKVKKGDCGFLTCADCHAVLRESRGLQPVAPADEEFSPSDYIAAGGLQA